MFLSEFKKLLEQRHNRENIYSKSSYWDSKAQQLNGHSVSMWKNNHLNDLYQTEQIDLILKTFPNFDGKVLLDLGCGTGRMSRWLAQRGATVTGIDFSNASLAIARKETQTGNPNYQCVSMFDLSETQSFDIVFSWGSIIFSCRDKYDLAKMMQILRNALKNNGEILLLEAIHRSFLHRVLNMDIEEFLEVVRSSGFEIKGVSSMHFWPVRIILAYISWPRIVTIPIYHLGQMIMRLPGFKKMGDYYAIYAIRK